MAGNDFSEEVKLFPALSRTEFFIIQIVKLIVLRQEHEDTILILNQQKIDYKDEIDLHMNKLETIWRTKEKEAIQSKIEYLRYKQIKLDELGMCLSHLKFSFGN